MTTSNFRRPPVLLIAAAGTIAVIGVTVTYLRYTKRRSKRNKSSSPTPSNNHHSHHSGLDPSFHHAATITLPEQLQDYLTTAEQLLLYALYKQATVGNAPTDKAPPAWHVVAHAKQASWSRLGGMSSQEAQDKYVYAVQQIQKRVARDDNGDCNDDDNGDCNDDDDDDDDDFADDDDDDDEQDESQAMAAPIQSRPAMAETGGVDDDDDDHDDANHKILVALFQAASDDDVDAIRAVLQQQQKHHDAELLVHQADVRTGQTMLHLAADKGSLQVVDYLIQEHSANVNAADADGISVLQTAVIAGHVATCRRLLQAGADPDQCDHDGDSARSSVEEDGTEELRALFAERTVTKR